VPGDKLDNLVSQAIDTLGTLLNSNDLSVQERSQVALRILEIASQSDRTLSERLSDASNSTSSTSSVSSSLPTNGNGGNVQTVSTQVSMFLPANYVQLDNFFSPEEYQDALDIAIKNEDNYVGSTTTTKVDNYRRSSVLYATLYPELYELLKKRILKVLPSVLKELKHTSFLVSKVEMQLTAHNDECFYKIHNDSGSEQTATRELTYVYYFYREPKGFSNGELRLYDTELRDGAAYNSSVSKTIEPRNNSIVFFNSRCKHEVLPVSCPSRQFADSRFTLNGWIRRVEV
jgi:Rps23 Pro-64 3,4-dihydroxylase Tpa1-like proline 4-hydroxylase